MTRNKPTAMPGGDLEFALLAQLWAMAREASVRELYEEVGAPRKIVYTTVAKVLDRLVEKRLVKRRPVGRAYVYTPVAGRDETQRAMARSLIERLVRDDDPEPAIAALVGAVEDVSPDLLDQLAAEIRTRQGSK
ncbi:MAG TPA: BlaI/MecI/CopY family transcriptional regulator [Myxococcales bacterium]|jgi:predicted transcriptional regulator